VVGIEGSLHDAAARNLPIGFYGGLGEHESVAAAYKQGRAAISLERLYDADRPQLKVRAGVDADQLISAQEFQRVRAVESAARCSSEHVGGVTWCGLVSRIYAPLGLATLGGVRACAG